MIDLKKSFFMASFCVIIVGNLLEEVFKCEMVGEA
jgi:hypothetical protein